MPSGRIRVAVGPDYLGSCWLQALRAAVSYASIDCTIGNPFEGQTLEADFKSLIRASPALDRNFKAKNSFVGMPLPFFPTIENSLRASLSSVCGRMISARWRWTRVSCPCDSCERVFLLTNEEYENL